MEKANTFSIFLYTEAIEDSKLQTAPTLRWLFYFIISFNSSGPKTVPVSEYEFLFYGWEN